MLFFIGIFGKVLSQNNSMENWFVDNFQNMTFLAVFLFSMLPLLEAKVAMPFGMSSSIWGQQALSPLMSFLASFLGSLTAGIIFYFAVKPIFNFCKKTLTFKKFADKIENKFKPKKELFFFRLILFISLPIPLTGVWTGAGLASFSQLGKAKSIIALIIGDFISCSLVFLICLFFGQSVLFLILASIVLVVLYMLVVKIVRFYKEKRINIVK